jgi:hypothetical protein
LCFLSNAIGNNWYFVVDASDANVGLGGYGFTANPNQYFTPSTPSLPSSIDLAFTDKSINFLKFGKLQSL